MKKTMYKRISMLMIFMMIISICVPVSAREYYNYESRYTIELSEEAYGKISKVNANLMSIILDDGVSMTFAVNNFFESLSEEEIGDTTEADYTIGADMFADTYNSAAYMKDEFFTKKLANVNGHTEMVNVTLIEINGKSFWEMTYNFLGEATEASSEDGGEDTAEGDSADAATDTPVREDGLAVIGEGRMYFALNEGFAYNIHVMCKENLISEYPELESIIDSIHLGRRQSDTMHIMWIVIGVLCVICLAMIIVVIMAKTPKQLAKERSKKTGIEEFDEEEQLRNNEFVNEKLEMIAKAHTRTDTEEELTVDDIELDEELIINDDTECAVHESEDIMEEIVPDEADTDSTQVTEQAEPEDDFDIDEYLDNALSESNSPILKLDNTDESEDA